jgi:prophage antirepressor-like protein
VNFQSLDRIWSDRVLTVLSIDDHHGAPGMTARKDAIDINDFVYAATGARVRRLTLPDGEHWFPAADVCRELGYVNTSEALRRHVPQHMRIVAGTLISREGLRLSAGHGLRKSMVVVSLKGLIRLVNGCMKTECEPFKNWVIDVVIAVQRDGSYSLEKAEVQPTTPDAPPAYAMPQQVADAIVRLEERNLRIDEEAAAAQRLANRTRRETVTTMKALVVTQQKTANALNSLVEAQQRSATAMYEVMAETIRSSQDVSRSMSRMANAMETMVDRLPPHGSEETVRLPRQRSASSVPVAVGMKAEQLLASWRARVTITDDVWAVAVLLAPVLVEQGEARLSVESIAERTGLTTARVHDSLRFLLKRQCIRQIGTVRNVPVYELHHA